MPNITYAFVSRCDGGCHVTMDVAVDGGQARRVVWDIDRVREAMGKLTEAQWEKLALDILGVRLHGLSRNEIQTAFQSGGGTVSVSIG